MSAEPPIRRSGADPLFSMVRYQPPILAPFGVGRAQACVITGSPALTSCACAGAAHSAATKRAEANVWTMDFIGFSLARARLVRTYISPPAHRSGRGTGGTGSTAR